MNLLTFSLKKNKTKNYNVLFVKINKEIFTASNSEVDSTLVEFKKYIGENPGILIIYDGRLIQTVDKKMIWENMHKVTTFNELGRKNIKAQSIIINNKAIISIVKTITKIHPFVVKKTSFVTNNKDALEYIESNL